MIGVLVIPYQVFAATTEISGTVQGDTLKIDILLTTAESINAIEGSVNLQGFAKNIRPIIQDGKSIISFWVEQPVIESDTITFSGIIPGGFIGTGPLFSITIPNDNPQGIVQITNISVLKNDGLGTPAVTNLSQLPINSDTIKRFAQNNQDGIDRDPPEVFFPQVTTSSELYKGIPTVTFIAQDKNSGIASYRIKEYRFGFERWMYPWRTSSGPYEKLRDRSQKSIIEIQAIDKSDNVRTVITAPTYPPRWYDSVLVKIFLGGILILIIMVGKKKYVHKKLVPKK
jgi:hypothetical protein